MQIRRWFLLVFTSFVLVGCSATGPQFKPSGLSPDGGAMVYVYRNDKFENSGISVPVVVDDVPAGKLANAGYLAIRVTQGRHLIRLELKGYEGFAGVSFDAQRNESIYLRLDTKYTQPSPYYGNRTFRLARVSEEIAGPEIALTRDSN